MQALVCFWAAILTVVRNSLRWHDSFALAIPEVLLGHHHGGMPKLVFGLHDIATRFRLVSAGTSCADSLRYDTQKKARKKAGFKG